MLQEPFTLGYNPQSIDDSGCVIIVIGLLEGSDKPNKPGAIN